MLAMEDSMNSYCKHKKADKTYCMGNYFVFLSLLVMLISFVPAQVEAATYIVDSFVDELDGNCGGDGDCSLRDAIKAANDNPGDDIVSVPLGTFSITISGDEDVNASGDFDISDNVTITGAGAASTVIRAGTSRINGIDRIFHVQSGATVVLDGVTVQYGRGDVASHHGGCINNAGNLTVRNSIVDNCEVKLGGDGGLIYSTGSLVIDNATLSNGWSSDLGGGVYATSMSIQNGASFTGNEGKNHGGGIYYDSTTDLNMSGDVSFISNITTKDQTTDNGGGIYTKGSIVHTSGTATFTSNAARRGAGVFVETSGKSVTFDALIASSNAASYEGGLFQTYGVTINGGGSISNNTAGNLGAAIYSLSNTVSLTGNFTFNNNDTTKDQTTDNGGAIWSRGSVSHSGGTIEFTNNDARKGGAIFIDNAGTVTLNAATFTTNTASYDGGAIQAYGTSITGGGSFTGNTAGNLGGAIYNKTGTVTLNGTFTFSGNDVAKDQTTDNGGAIWSDSNVTHTNGTILFEFNDARRGGGIYSNSGSVSLVSPTFDTNTASYLGGAIFSKGLSITGGGTFTSNTAGDLGGAIHNGTGTVTLDGTFNFTNNKVTNDVNTDYGGGIWSAGDVTHSNGSISMSGGVARKGGAIYSNTGAVSLNDATFTSNFANYQGGAIFSNGLTITGGATFSGNYTNDTGGAIYNKTNQLKINGNASFTNNYSLRDLNTDHGGAIWSSGNIILNDISGTTTFTSNNAWDGGAIYLSAGTFIGNGTVFTTNDATRSGGAIYTPSTATFNGVTFTGNTARYGGALYANGTTTVTIKKTLFENNSTDAASDYKGGAIFALGTGTTLNIANSTFSGNTAYNRAGAINSNGSSCTIRGSTFYGNTSTQNEDVIYGNCTLYGTIVQHIGDSPNMCSAGVTGGEYNYQYDGDATATCFTVSGTNYTGNPQINTTLAANGGDPKTHALLNSSTLIDSIPSNNTSVCTHVDINSEDQRGFTRPEFGGTSTSCDIGAYEYNFPGVAISGSVYSDKGQNKIASDVTVRFLVNGANPVTITTSGGDFSRNVEVNAGDVLTVYVDGSGSYKATAVTIGDGNPISGLNLYHNHLITRFDNGTGSINNVNLLSGDDGDADIIYNVSGSTLTTDSGVELLVWSGDTFQPNGVVNAFGVDVNGTFNAAGNAVNVAGGWDATGGVFTSTATVTFNASSGINTITPGGTGENNDFHNLNVNDGGGTASFRLAGALDVNANLSVINGIFDTSTSNHAVTVGGNFTQSAGSQFVANSSSLNITGNFSANGSADGATPNTTVSANYNNASLTMAGNASILTFNSLAQPWNNGFKNLVIGQTSGQIDTITTTSNQGLAIGTQMSVGNGEVSGSSPVYLRGATNPLSVDTANSKISVESLRFFGGNQNIPSLTLGYDSNVRVSGPTNVSQTGNITLNSGKSLILDGEGDLARVVSYTTGGHTLTVGGSVVVGNGSDSGTKNLNFSNGTVNVAGNFTVHSGTNTLATGASKLVLNGTGTQALTSGGQALYDLEVTNPSGVVTFNDSFTVNNLTAETPSSQLTFASGQTFNIGGKLKLNGQDTGTRIKLRSTGTQYTLNVTGGVQTVAYVDVQYSNADGSDINAGDSQNSGFNDDLDVSPHWAFVGGFPFGGFTENNVIPTSEVTQATDGSGKVTVKFRAKDSDLDGVNIKHFQYSVDGGATWVPATPGDLDSSTSLSTNWKNGGSSYSSAADWTGNIHSFDFDTTHADVSGMDGVDQSDVRVRFIVNDGTFDSLAPVVTDAFSVDNEVPTPTISSAKYNAPDDELVITGTNFTTIATALSDISGHVDWSKFVWDINGSNAADITFDGSGVSSLVVTDATTLTLSFTVSKANQIETATGYGLTGGEDKLDVTAGFIKDAAGNASSTDGVVNAPLVTNIRPVGGYTADDVIPSAQVGQSSNGDGLVTVNWKARDGEVENVTLHSFQYSIDGGTSWVTPTNGDSSTAFSTNWNNNGGSGFITATSLASATAHNFTFDTNNSDFSDFNSTVQSNVRVRFYVKDDWDSSVDPTVSGVFDVDNTVPTATITSASYSPADDTLTITGSNFNSIATNSTDIKGYVNWSKFVWDVNSDNTGTANITFDGAGVTSFTVTSDTQLTLLFNGTKAGNIEGTAGFGGSGGADALDLTTGFFRDAKGNAATGDAINDAPISVYVAAVNPDEFVQTDWGWETISSEGICSLRGGSWVGGAQCIATKTDNSTGWEAYSAKDAGVGLANLGADLDMDITELSMTHRTSQAFSTGSASNIDIKGNRIVLDANSRTVNWDGTLIWSTSVSNAGYTNGVYIVPGDFDGDGDIDFIHATSAGDQWLRAWKNDGTNTWATAPIGWSINTGSTSWKSATSGDFNNDGIDDLSSSGNFYLSPGVEVAEDIAWTTTAWSNGFFADLDGDGDMDRFSYNGSSWTSYWGYENTAVGENLPVWGPQVVYRGEFHFPLPTYVPHITDMIRPYHSTFADLDGDGDPELIKNYGEDSSPKQNLWRNDGNGLGTMNWVNALADRSTWLPANANVTNANVHTRDVDGDMLPDMFLAQPDGDIYVYKNTSIVDYMPSGSITSDILDFGSHAGYTSLEYTSYAVGGATVKVEVRAGDDPSRAGEWPVQWTEVANGGSLSALGSYRYAQYKVTLTAGFQNGREVTPGVTKIKFNYAQTSSAQSLTSSWFNSEDAGNRIWGLKWIEDLASSADVRLQLRTAPDNAGAPGTASSWMGPDGTSGTYWNSANTHGGSCSKATYVACSRIPAALRDGSADQWVQYKVELASGGIPKFSEIILQFRSTAPAGISLSKYGLSTSEAETTDSFDVTLNSQPGDVVTIDLSTDKASEVLITSATQLVFTPDNWNVAQTVNVRGVNDPYSDGDQVYSITLNASSGDQSFENLADVVITGTNTNDDVPSIIVSKSSVTTTEAGGTDTFTIHLGSEPATAVLIPISVSNLTEVDVTTNQLVLNSENWSTPQVVTVIGKDDGSNDGDINYNIFLGPTISGDAAYHEQSLSNITGTNNDNDVIGVSYSPNSGLVTTEGGGSVAVGIKLTAKPNAEVVINLTSNDPGEGALNVSTLSFNAVSWNQPQYVTITGVDDSIQDTNQLYTVSLDVVSGDPAYNGLPVADISITNNDDDDPSSDASFNQSRWGTATPTNGTLCADTSGTWNGSQCVATSANNQSGWETYESLGTGLSSVNGGFDLQASVATHTLTHTSKSDFGRVQSGAVVHSTDADFIAAPTKADVLIENNTLKLNGTLSGSLETAAFDAGVHSGYSTLNLKLTRPAGTTFTVELMAADSLDFVSNPTSWMAFQDGNDISALGTRPYVKYRINMTSTSTSVTPVLDEISIGYSIDTISLGSGYPSAPNIDTVSKDRLSLAISSGPNVSFGAAAFTFNFAAIDNYNPRPTVGDFDMDGDIDMMVVPHWTGGNVVAKGLRNIGTNQSPNWVYDTKWNLINVAVGGRYQSGDAGDLDNDGDPDMIVSGEAYRNDGLQSDGSLKWTRMTAWDGELAGGAVQLGDVDGDGDLDVTGVRPCCGFGKIYFWKNNGDIYAPNFDRHVDWDLGWASSTNPWGSLVDPDGDGDMDLIEYSEGKRFRNDAPLGGMAVWVDAGGWGTWSPTADYVNMIDVNGDELPDAFVGTGTNIKYHLNTTTYVYHSTATYVSEVLDFGQHSGFTTLDYSSRETNSSSVEVSIRGGNDTDADSWAQAWVTVANAGSLAAFDSYRYLQYRVVLNAGTGNNTTPTLDDISISYKSAAREASIESSYFDSAADKNVISGLEWAEILATNTDVRVQIRTAPDNAGYPGVWNDWVGPDGLAGSYWNSINTYPGGCVDSSGSIACSVIPVALRNSETNRWMQYKVTFISDGAASATLSDIRLSYATATTSTAMVVTPIVLNTTEGGSSTSFLIRPASYSTSTPVGADTTVEFQLSDPTEGRLSKDSVTFLTTESVFTGETITVYPVDDAADDGNVTYTIYTSAAISTDPTYDNIEVDNVTVTNTDNELGGAGFTVSPISGLRVYEANTGTGASFTVTPDVAPTQTVTVDVTLSDGSEATVTPAQLSFSAASTASKNVTVYAKDDAFLDNDVTFNVILHPAISDDTNFNGIDPTDVEVTAEDNDTVDLVITGGPFTTTEVGGIDLAYLALNAAPSADVRVDLSSSDLSEGTVFPTSVTFTSTNYASPKMIYIYGRDDNEQDGNVSYSIVTSPFSSTDGSFNGIDPSNISVSNTDNDTTPGVVLSSTEGLETSEDGGEARFSVELKTRPTHDVVFTFVSDQPTEGVVAETVTIPPHSSFWAGTWVTIIGVDDSLDDSDQGYTIRGSYTSQDANYASGTLADIKVVNRSSNSKSIEYDQAGAHMGRSVAFADVNGDHRADLIVGAPNDASNTGAVLVYHGTGTAYKATHSWKATGEATNNYFGYSVANAGDLDNDGYEDVIVGAYGYGSNQGAVYIYRGSSGGLLPTPAKAIYGGVAGDYFGFSVNGGANVNGDDYDDVIIGAYGFSSSTGKAVVYHGAATISSMTESWSKAGVGVGNQFGYSVAFAGNVDGSNGADAVVGAPAYNNGAINDGRVYLFESTGASGLNSNALWTKEGIASGAGRFGEAVASAGDIDNDGFGDVVIGAPNYSNGESNEGAVYVFHGETINGLGATHELLIESDQAGALYGSAVASAGDVNSDGYSDVIVGAPDYTNIYPTQGQVFIYVGSSSTLVSSAYITKTPSQVDANYGVAVAGGVDFDLNGYSDYAVGANLFDNPDSDEGRVFVYRKAADQQKIKLVDASTTSTSESGGKAALALGLNSAPAADVMLVVSSDDTTEGLVENAVVIIEAGNWKQSKTVTIAGQDDSVDDGPKTYHISVVAYSSDPFYDGLTLAPVTMENKDDETTVSVVLTDGSADEDGNRGSVTFFRTEPLDSSLMIYYGMSGSATAVDDYVGPNGIITIPAGESSAVVELVPLNDNIDESDEIATIQINAHASYIVGAASTQNITIKDTDNTVSVGVTDGVAGESGVDQGMITFNRTAPFDSPLTVNYTLGGVAISGTDYNTLSGSITIGAGDNSAALSIVPINDDVDEEDESFSLTVSASSNYLLGVSTAGFNILDDDTAGIVVNPTSGLNVTEAGGIDTFTIVLNSEPTSNVIVGLSSDDPTEADVTPTSLTFTNANWNVARTVTVVGRDDLVVDTDQTFDILTAQAVSNDVKYSVINPSNVSVTNKDDDVWPNITVTANDASVMESSGNSSFVINRTGPTVSNLTVNYTLSGGAVNGTDYNALSGSVVIGVGQSNATVVVSPVNNGASEGAKTVILSVDEDANYVVDQPGSATITIIDDEAPLTPIANFAVDQVVEEGDNVNVNVYLLQTDNIVYPVTIPYTVGGTTDGADHSAVSGSLVIGSPNLFGTISFTTNGADGTDADETVVFTMGTPTNADAGGRSVHTVTLAETNVAPIVKLVATQGGLDKRLIITGDGNVTITSTVRDPNVGDTQSYDWSATNNALVDIDGDVADGVFTFDPSGLTEDFYNISLTVTDSGALTTTVELLIDVVASAPVLSVVDTDGDGVTDDLESVDDQDKDGIPDYLDSSELASNELQVSSSNPGGDSYIMQTDAGLTLRLGDVAFAAGADGAEVSADDIINFGDNEGGSVANGDDTVGNVIGYFDFEVADLGELGQTVQVVLPLLQAIPEEPVYRKYDKDVGWFDFVVDSKNSIASAAGNPGQCPPPGDAAYTAGMTVGHYCLQLSIEDGGPNDTDGVANYVVEDPGKVMSTAVTSVTDPGPSTGGSDIPTNTTSGGGSGAMHLYWMLVMFGFSLWCRRRERFKSHSQRF